MLELRAWLECVDSFDFWGFNVWLVAASLFVNGYIGPEARNDARGLVKRRLNRMDAAALKMQH